VNRLGFLFERCVSRFHECLPFLLLLCILSREFLEFKNFSLEGKGKGKPKERGIRACARVKVIKLFKKIKNNPYSFISDNGP
jgi:hypothetical protein